jgi:hypothetical protein
LLKFLWSVDHLYMVDWTNILVFLCIEFICEYAILVSSEVYAEHDAAEDVSRAVPRLAWVCWAYMFLAANCTTTGSNILLLRFISLSPLTILFQRPQQPD